MVVNTNVLYYTRFFWNGQTLYLAFFFFFGSAVKKEVRIFTVSNSLLLSSLWAYRL